MQSSLAGPRRAAALLLTCLFGALSACGTASRAVLARQDFVSVYQDPEALTKLRGAEAGQAFLWLESARLAAVESTEQALTLVDRGLTFHPVDPGLLTARIELLGGLGRFDECLSSARQALASLPVQGSRPSYRMGVIRALLALDRPAEVEAEILALGGEVNVPEALVASAWGRVALAYANLGQPADADRCLDASLERGSDGLAALAQESLAHPELLAAARSLRRSATVRHPQDPDLALTVVIDEMELGHYGAASARLEQLPRPLPPRLGSDVLAMGARLLILQGKVHQGLARIFRRLDQQPLDPPALGVLQETWSRFGQPSDQELLRRLLIARRHVDPRDQRTLARLDAILDELEGRIRAPGRGDDPP